MTAGRDALQKNSLGSVYVEGLAACNSAGCRPGGKRRLGVQAANSTGWTTKELSRQRKLLEAQRDALMDKMEEDRKADDDDDEDDDEDDGAAPLLCLLARVTDGGVSNVAGFRLECIKCMTLQACHFCTAYEDFLGMSDCMSCRRG